MSKLTELEHTADRAFLVRGDDLRELFANAADALFRLQRQPAGRASDIIRQVEVEGFDRETLLVNWLNEILYLQGYIKRPSLG
jgi:SHS2 domain-containing protein